MKNLKYLIYLSTIIATFSCSELEEEPYGFLANDNFYSTEENVYSGLQYAYQASKRAQFYSRLLNITLMGAGQSDTKPSYTQRNAVEFKNWTFDASTEALRDFFGGCYTGISRANTVLDNTEKIDFSDDLLKNQYVGEAKCRYTFESNPLAAVPSALPLIENAGTFCAAKVRSSMIKL
jgi:hypothetical protein